MVRPPIFNPEIQQRLEAIALLEERPIEAVIKTAVENYLRNQDWIAERVKAAVAAADADPNGKKYTTAEMRTMLQEYEG
jgi:predicted transcriptional regulator